MNKKDKNIQEIILISIGALVFSCGLTWFIAPLNMVIGGISGIAVIIRQLSSNYLGFAVPLYITNLILNIPLFVMSIYQRGFKFARKSFYAVISISIYLWLLEFIPNLIDLDQDILLGSVFGGVTSGVGIGLILRAGATSGGTDMLASIIKYKNHHFPITRLMLIIDGLVIAGGFFVFGIRQTMYALIAVVISIFVMNSILDGMHFAKAVYIISDKNEEVSRVIIEELKRGNTGIKARGMFSKKESEMLLVIVAPREIAQLRMIVQGIDKDAFMIISDVKEVLGEGFTEEYDYLTS